MNKDQDWKNLGEQILDSVADALNSGDFRQLNNLVSGTVDNVVQEAKKQADAEREERIQRYSMQNSANYEKWQQQQEELRRRQEERREEWRKMREAQLNRRQRAENDAGETRQQSQAQEAGQASESVRTTPKRPPKAAKVKFNGVGSVANILNTVFGALGIGTGLSAWLAGIILTALGFSFGAGFFSVGLVISIISGILLVKGSKQRRLLKRAQRYIQLCGPNMYANIDELARQTGQSVKFVRKDIKKMLRKGMFPEGHLDRTETCFMLSDEVYRQYTETSQAYKMQDQMEAEKRAAQQAQEQDLQSQQMSELDAMMTEGMEYLQKLRTLNDAIPGEEISTQLSQLESLLRQIFERVKDHPEQMHRMHKLMEYYLPTTVKLVEAYVQFEKVETPGKDIQGAKAEILKTLGIINEAFTELLNNLFQDEVFDATTDAQVLQTMLSREGLRHEMDTSNEMNSEDQADSSNEVKLSNGMDFSNQEESPFSFQAQPEQPQVLGNLKAPWES